MLLPSDGGRLIRRIFPPTVWQRRCLWVWNAGNDEKTTADWIEANAKRLGYTAVCVKVHDGPDIFDGPNGSNSSSAYFRRLKQAGLKVGGWGYLTGDGMDGRARDPSNPSLGNTELEAQRAVERCKTFALDFYVSDPEDHYTKSGDNGYNSPAPGDGKLRFAYSARFVRAFAAAIRNPHFPRGVASYGRVDFHDLDWHAWSARGSDGSVWRCVPQAYANESQALAVDLCVRAAMAYWPLSLIHPLLGVYAGALGRHSPALYQEELSRAGTVGYGIYSLDSVDPASVSAYGRLSRARS